MSIKSWKVGTELEVEPETKASELLCFIDSRFHLLETGGSAGGDNAFDMFLDSLNVFDASKVKNFSQPNLKWLGNLGWNSSHKRQWKFAEMESSRRE